MSPALDRHAAAILKPGTRPKRKPGKKPKHYGYSDPKHGWTKPVIRIPNPIQRSVIDLVYCGTCRAYQLEGSKQLGYCRTCGTVNA